MLVAAEMLSKGVEGNFGAPARPSIHERLEKWKLNPIIESFFVFEIIKLHVGPTSWEPGEMQEDMLLL